ncbi:MAG: MJ1255/VC2487 family glycosyltransferase [Candidatus Nanoarchaeia archaeon]
MKILISVCSEGMGHATRSKTIADHLKKQGHDVRITAGVRAYTYILEDYPTTTYADGLHIVYRNNKAHISLSILNNILHLPIQLKSLWATKKLFDEFKPDLVISDYTFIAPYLAKLKKIPVITIDNIRVSSFTRIGVGLRNALGLLSVKLYSGLMASAEHIIPAFFFPPVKAHLTERVTLCDPPLSEKIIKQNPHKKNYILVYQTHSSHSKLTEHLKRIDHKFIVYGMHKEEKEDNLQFKTFSDEFITDVANAEAVITNGGFTLLAEALYFKKPILSIPVYNQFEQELNAIYIDRLGYGKHLKKSSVEDIKKFIKNKHKYENSLDKYNPDPVQCLKVLDQKIKKLTA